MGKWWRTLAGLGAGAANMFANGTNWKQILVSLAVAGLGIVTQVTGVQDGSIPASSVLANGATSTGGTTVKP